MFARRSVAFALLALAGGAGAQESGYRVETSIEVISPRPDAMSITIYRDLFALITETRTVDLPAEPVTLTFAGVVETLIPQSAVVQQLDRKLEERNYDYDRLAPASLLRKSVGKTVTLTRTAPGSGKVTQVRAVIVAANDDGITLRTEQGNEALHCSGIPESLTFDEMPAELHPEPKLSVRLAGGTPGKQTIRVSYLAQGFAWASAYVARLDSHGTSMDLMGWVNLQNFTNSGFRDAQVQVVAGRLNLLYDEDGGTSTIGATEDFENEEELQQARETRLAEVDEEREDAELDLAMLSGCYPFGAPVARTEREVFERSRLGGFGGGYGGYEDGMLEEVIVTGMRRSVASLETLGDYQLYRLPWPTDLNARQTKQAVFLDKQDVKVERLYSFRFDEYDFDDDEPFVRPNLMVSFENRKSSGLGEPLPAGIVRFFDAATDGDVFAGEARMGDKPIGLPIELQYARAMDLMMRIEVDDDLDDVPDDAEAADITFAVANAKPLPVAMEIRQALNEDIANARIVKANHRTTRKFGDYAWRFTVPANSAGSLTYRLLVPEED